MINEYVWSAVFIKFQKLKTPFWAKKQKRTEMRRGSTFYARLLYLMYRKGMKLFSVFENIEN